MLAELATAVVVLAVAHVVVSWNLRGPSVFTWLWRKLRDDAR